MNTCHSNFADLIQTFVDYRKASGMDSQRFSYDLGLFAKFCTANYPHETLLTQGMVDTWFAKRDTELNRSCNTRVRPIREFIKYLQKNNLTDVRLPPILKAEPRTYIPHNFTHAELKRFFAECDNLPCKHRNQQVRKLGPVHIRQACGFSSKFSPGARRKFAGVLTYVKNFQRSSRQNLPESRASGLM